MDRHPSNRQLMLADLVMVLVAGLVATVLQWIVKPVPGFIVQVHLLLLVASLPLFLAAAWVTDLYRARADERPSDERLNIIKTVGVWVGGLALLTFVIQYDGLSRFWVISLAVSATLALIIEREVARRIHLDGAPRNATVG